jgi:methanogenic corrinoid protein MtbC1
VLDREGVSYLYDRTIRGALEAVGERWRRNEITVADEHLAACTVNVVVASLYPLFPWPAVGPRAIVACPPGERHDLGARMVADLLALDGWDAAFLGADTPPEALVRMATDHRAVLVALSVTLASHLPGARTVVKLLREEIPTAKILVGGRAIADLEHPAEALAVDAVALSGTGAVHAARSFKL